MKFLFSLAFCIALCVPSHAQSQIGGRVSPDGTEEIRVDLPDVLHIRNTGGTDGAGLCVWASLSMAGEWAGEEKVARLFSAMQRKPGGGWPERVDSEMKSNAPGVGYFQHTGGDSSILKAVVNSGRIACITYGYSPRYRGGIDHMVCCVHYSDKWAAVLDNNFPTTFEWMPPAELNKRWLARSGGWLAGLISPPPPPIPVNRKPRTVYGQCQGGACQSPALPSNSPQTWVEVIPGSNWFDVWQDGRYLGRQYSAPATVPSSDKALSPITDKLAKQPDPVDEYFTGVVAERVKDYGSSVNGVHVRSEDFLSWIQGTGIVPDDTKRMTVTIMGPSSTMQDTLRDMRKDATIARFLDSCKVRCMSPMEPLCRDVGISGGRDFSIVIQGPEQPDGKAEVLHRQNDFKDGGKAFLSAIRKIDPAYDASKDPDLRASPTPIPSPTPSQDQTPWYLNPLFLSVAVGIVALLVPSPFKPFVSWLAAWIATKQPAAIDPAVLAPLLDRLKKLEEVSINNFKQP